MDSDDLRAFLAVARTHTEVRRDPSVRVVAEFLRRAAGDLR